MVKAMLKLSKLTYVIGLLSMLKIWVKSGALNLGLTYLIHKLVAEINQFLT